MAEEDGIKFNFTADSMKIPNNLVIMGTKVDAAVKILLKTESAQLQSYARQNRMWTDRTGDARRRLTAYLRSTNDGYRIYLAHGVDYGIWLELANEKRFAIIEPSIRLKSPEIIRHFQGLMSKINVI